MDAVHPPTESTLRTAIQGVSILGPGWRRMGGLFSISVLVTLFEGFGIGMMLPIADLLQKGGDVSSVMQQEGYWRHLSDIAEEIGLTLSLSTLLLASLVLFMIRNALMYARTIAMTASMQDTVRDIRVRGFQLFLHARCDFQDRVSVGQLANDLTVQAATGAGAVHALVTLSHILLMALYYLGFLLVLSSKLTIAILGVTLLAILLVRPLSRYSNRVGDRLIRANQSASTFLVECLGAARLIRLAQMERAEIEQMRERSTLQVDCEVAIARYSARTSVIMETFVVVCGMALLYVGTTVLQLDLATIGVTLIILLRQLPVAREFVVARQAIVSNVPAVSYLMRLFKDMETAAEQDVGIEQKVHLRRGIMLRDVVFQYDSDREPALRGLNLTIPAGGMTALVGPSGGGKSTLIDLLPRLREPTSGEILIDGRPIAEFKRSALRSLIGYTPQTPQIFNLTIAQHIRYGKPEATDAEVRGAARLAGADEFIEKCPNRYDTMLGERGVHLSGGQKQRIDVARALLGGCEVLILDEPTSNVDAETEHFFEQTLQKLRRESGRTMIVVGHRLSTVRNADQIAVVSAGAIAECGTHDELVRSGGWYAKAYQLQARGLSAAEVAE